MRVGEQGSVVDDRDACRQALDVGADVRGENDDPLAGHIAQKRSKSHAFLGIQSRRRFVDDQEPRVVEQRLRDADALAHAAGETAQRPRPCVREVESFQQHRDAGAQLAPPDAFQRADVFEELDRREMRIDAEVLREIAERAAKLVGRFGDVASVEADRPAAGPRYRREHAHQRRFSRAVGAEQPQNSGLEPHREISHGADRAVAFVQSINLEFHRRIYTLRQGVVSGMMAGELCRLRPYRTGDASALCAVADDFEVARWMARRFPHPYKLRAAEEWIAIAMADPRGRILAIEVDGAIAGGIAIEPHRGERAGAALFGYWLGRAY